MFHTGKLWEMINVVFKEHTIRNPNCKGKLGFDSDRERKWGCVWREAVKCDKCRYKSAVFPLYEEIKTKGRGRRSATANVGLNIALTQTPIGFASVRKIFIGANIPPPSTKGLQTCANKVCKLVKSENIMDMKSRRQQLKKINSWSNRPKNEINIQCDGMYNNNWYSGVGRTPFQPATQCTYTVAENITNKKQIIGLETVNKLCSKHGYHTQTDDECDIKCDACSTTACMETNIGDEEKWAEMSLKDLQNDGLEVKYITTDPDTKAYQAAEKLYKKGVTKTKPEHQIDTRHLSENHRKQIKKSNNVLKMMPGPTKAHRMYLRNRFATDLSKRCQAEFNRIHEKMGGDFTSILSHMPKCINAIKKCYFADHSFCKLYSEVCNGEQNDNWIKKGTFLPKSFKINSASGENEKTLLECIEYRLSDSTLQYTKLNSNTQKVEATNRSLKRSLPKNSTFSRNFTGRAHSAIHSVNNGPDSLRKLCASAGCPITRGSRCDQALSSIERIYEKEKKRQVSLPCKQKRKKRRNAMFQLYEKHQEKRKYIKAQLLKSMRRGKSKPKPAADIQASTSREHSYNRALKTKRTRHI